MASVSAPSAFLGISTATYRYSISYIDIIWPLFPCVNSLLTVCKLKCIIILIICEFEEALQMNWAAFCSYVLLTAITPGPNNIMSMSNAAKYGFKRSFPFNVGVLLGFFVVMGLCAAFSSLLYEFIPSVKPYMLCLGAAYILWLAWSIWRDKPHAEKKSIFTRTNTVVAGAVLQLVNVKVILYGITSLSSVVLPHYDSIPVLALFCFILSVTGFLCTLLWALFGAVFEKFFKKYSKIVNAVMALLLVYCAVTMVLDIWA